MVHNHVYEHLVDPAASLNAVKATNDELELSVVVFVLVLDLTAVWGDPHTRTSLLDKFGSNFGFEFAHIGTAKEKLTVQVRDIDRI